MAFKSRVHLAIHYTTLDANIRRELWQLFLQRATADSQNGNEWVNDELNRLASFNINGREIKNTVMTANGMAMSEGTRLNVDHINIVLKYLQKFETDLAIGRTEILPEKDSEVGGDDIHNADRPAKKRRRL